AEIPGAADGDPDELATIAVALMYERIKATLTRYGVQYDRFFSEKSLYDGDPSPVKRAEAQLEQLGHTYRHEGALWLRTTSFGDDKDRVLERSNGEPTYFASDVAYLESKRERGFERQLNVFGADHHGYVARLKAAMEALGGDPEKLEILIMRLVHFVEAGEREKMSKRRGIFTTLDELLDELGVDATRFFMLQRTHDTSLDLDLDLARKQSSENPVYYVQYAHARIASMLERAGAETVDAALAGVAGGGGGGDAAGAVAGRTEPLDPAERTLLKKLLAFPDEIAEAAEKRAPHRLTAYALELAQDFTAFYRDCRVLGAEGEGVEASRIALLVATRRTIARTLALLGVSAPDSMARLGGGDVAAEPSA
ncbi:MAG TPA: arginine--tRNA ligase, partial [Conexibacter sp.]|nr:arginine--tRNA ligase [Conexibacter sp.]